MVGGLWDFMALGRAALDLDKGAVHELLQDDKHGIAAHSTAVEGENAQRRALGGVFATQSGGVFHGGGLSSAQGPESRRCSPVGSVMSLSGLKLVVAWSWSCGGVGLTLAGCWRRWVVVKLSSQARKERNNVSERNILGLDKAQSRDGADNVAAVFRSDW
jgi:hypothetical protein